MHVLLRRLLALVAAAAVTHAAVAAAPVSTPATYRTVNLMPEFWSFYDKARTLPVDAQGAVFARTVVKSHPEVYNHAVIGGDTSKPFEQMVADRYVKVQSLIGPRMDLMRAVSARIGQDLPRYEARFRKTFPDLAYKGELYFMYSLGGFDGATRKVHDQTALLFGLDMITWVYGKDADPEPFFDHELFHIYHKQYPDPAPGYSDKFVSALWGEGLAMHVAQTMNPQAHGVAIFGLPRNTPERAQAMVPALARDIRRLLDSTSPDDYKRFFLGSSEQAETPARSGYYVGFLVAQKLGQRHSLQELAHTPVSKLRPEIEAALDELAQAR